jgi:hypothetical protein
VRFNWTTHSFRYDLVDTYFGTSVYTLDVRGSKPLITSKYVVLKNDYIHHVWTSTTSDEPGPPAGAGRADRKNNRGDMTMTYNIALQFEDGVTRTIPCEADELVSEAAYGPRSTFRSTAATAPAAPASATAKAAPTRRATTSTTP